MSPAGFWPLHVPPWLSCSLVHSLLLSLLSSQALVLPSHRIPLVFPHAAVFSLRTIVLKDHLREPSALNPLQRHWKVFDPRREESLPWVVVLTNEVLIPILYFSLSPVRLSRSTVSSSPIEAMRPRTGVELSVLSMTFRYNLFP